MPMPIPPKTVKSDLMPTVPDVARILNAKLQYEAAQLTPEKKAWNDKNFNKTPWGIAWQCSRASHDKYTARAKAKGSTPPAPKNNIAIKTFIIAVLLDWQDLVIQIKRTLGNWGYTKEDIKQIAAEIWLTPDGTAALSDTLRKAMAATAGGAGSTTTEQLQTNIKSVMTEAVEKHDKLNPKLFTKDDTLKTNVRAKLLEIVDEFLDDLKEQDISIKVDDIIMIGSNASYNYTKDSDIDLHIVANTNATKYDPDVANALYSAYRSLFNKQLDISIYGIKLELFVETENAARTSNGVYSVKKDKWIATPVYKDIPEYDTDVLNKLVAKWQSKCDELIDDIKADKLNDEKRVVRLLTDIYDKLRKKGIAKSEYSVENLAFKELRNNGYLDKLKEYKNELVSKRLSLEEQLDRKTRAEIYNKLAIACGTAPIIQDNGMFYIYNIKSSELSAKLRAIKQLPFISEVYSHENGKYDFNNMFKTGVPTKYYDIRGKIKE
jgi:predicted nucleotidyltransferase